MTVQTVPDRLGTDYQPGRWRHGLRFCYQQIAPPQEATFSWGTLDVLETGDYDCDGIEWEQGAETGGANVAGRRGGMNRLGKAGADRRGLYCTNSPRKPSSWQDVSSRPREYGGNPI